MNDFVDFMLETINNLDNQSDENIDEGGDAGTNQSEWKNYAKSKNLKFTQKMTPEEIETLIIGQAFETFISGIDTTTGLASITTYFLAKEQQYQDQVSQEIEVSHFSKAQIKPGGSLEEGQGQPNFWNNKYKYVFNKRTIKVYVSCS